MKRKKRNISHRVRDILIFLITILGIARMYRKWVKKNDPLVRVLVFHDVHDREWFELMIETLTKHYHVITPEDFHAKHFHPSRINVLITFDDGYASWETAVQSVFKENELRGLFFINSALMDVAHNGEWAECFMREQLLISPRVPLTWEGVQKLRDAGHTIGGHSLTHPNLTNLSEKDMMREILDDKHAIERHLDTILTDFAYPFGTRAHVNEAVRESVQASGYFHGYTTVSRFVDFDEPFSIPRTCIENESTPHELKRWVGGGYDLFVILKDICVR